MTRQHNHGLRKRCGCPRAKWPKCSHGWHFNFRWKGVNYRLSLDRECGHHIQTKTEAQAEAERLRIAIREDRYGDSSRPASLDALTFAEFAKVWEERRGKQLVRPQDNRSRLNRVEAFILPGTQSPTPLGQKPLRDVTTDDIEAFRDARRAQGLSPVTVNHDLKLLRKMLNWGVRKGYLDTTPFKRGTEPVIQLEREIPRARRLEDEADEQRLLESATPHLRSIIIALLDTACRPGEILSLQWADVNLERRELTVRAMKAKTRTARIVPLSSRLIGVLEMRRLDPAGRQLGPDAYVFGNVIGQRVKSVQDAWCRARTRAGLGDLQLRDLRHEAGSRFAEAGMPINYVSGMLGHTNLTTTSRYLNINRRELHRAMQRYEETRQSKPEFAQSLHKQTDTPPAVVQQADPAP